MKASISQGSLYVCCAAVCVGLLQHLNTAAVVAVLALVATCSIGLEGFRRLQTKYEVEAIPLSPLNSARQLAWKTQVPTHEVARSASSWKLACNDGSFGAVLEDGSFVCKCGSLSPEELELARQNFLKFDVDGDGVISRADFGQAMGVYDSSWTEESGKLLLDSLFAAANIDGSGRVTPAQFCVMRVDKKKTAAIQVAQQRKQASHGGSPRRRIPGRCFSPAISPVTSRPPTIRAADSSSDSSWPSPWFVRASPRASDGHAEHVVAARCSVHGNGHVELTVMATRPTSSLLPASALPQGRCHRPPSLLSGTRDGKRL